MAACGMKVYGISNYRGNFTYGQYTALKVLDISVKVLSLFDEGTAHKDIHTSVRVKKFVFHNQMV